MKRVELIYPHVWHIVEYTVLGNFMIGQYAFDVTNIRILSGKMEIVLFVN